MNIKPIKSEADYEKALSEINGLMGAATGAPESDQLEVLVTLVEAYESGRCRSNGSFRLTCWYASTTSHRQPSRTAPSRFHHNKARRYQSPRAGPVQIGRKERGPYVVFQHQCGRYPYYGHRGRISAREVYDQVTACSCLTLILACIVYWQAREISRLAAAPDFPFDPALLRHLSPIEWKNIILYGEIKIDPAKLTRRNP